MMWDVLTVFPLPLSPLITMAWDICTLQSGGGSAAAACDAAVC
jgi:hypothetical protein